MPLLITDAAVITMDSVSGAVPITASIRIVDDVITAIGPGLEPEPGDEVLDGRDRLVTPGFVNAHTHSWEYLYKGRYDNLPLELWMLLSYPILGDSRVAPDLIRLRSSLFALESLKAGVTTLVDDVLENPDQISKYVLERGLDQGTAFEILSIDIADVDVGRNIGAELQTDQAEADKKIAQAKAEERRSMALAAEQEMRAKVVEAEAEVPLALAEAFRSGRLGVMDYYNMENVQADTRMRESVSSPADEPSTDSAPRRR
jgi:cytosine/adenosine deaminase-related metal-dependent hydrolase